jgi:peptidoglycan/xylan/chitin deacetylase (PgdA/CDA1 family)
MKAQVKWFMSSILVLLGLIRRNNRIPVLLYHSVDETGSVISISPAKFRNQMEYLWSNKYRTIPLLEYLECLSRDGTEGLKNIVLTFDDGFKNNYNEVFPILKKFGFSATIFLTTDHIGGLSTWEKHSSIPDLPLLSWDEILEMSQNGIDFGSHTCSHPILTGLSQNEIQSELGKSKEIIEQKLDQPVRFFCHPYGIANLTTRDTAKKCGYLGAFGGLDFSLANSLERKYDLTRAGTNHFSNLQDFKAGLAGTYHWYIQLRKFFGKK